MRRLLDGLRGLTLVEGEVEGLVAESGVICGVRLRDGGHIRSRAVILTTGTFLGGLLHTGEEQRPGGRFGERPSTGLSADLESLGLDLRRFKTGTPPRLARASLDLGKVEVQAGDAEPRPFSWRTREVRNLCVCWVTRTPAAVQSIIRENLERSPLFAGAISGVGPRYCPSIEDKVVRFPHHDRHTVFLEPEGLQSESIYVNGLSTSLPRDVQELVVRSVPGLERAVFLRYGYAVEYDVVAPQQITPKLECRDLPGLYLAGQLLGTSGYEEAAALGLLAGINAVQRLREREPFLPGREDAYLGVMLDDLCGREHREPYRMFTSRAEHRLVLGVDSSRERLMGEGHRLGLVPARAFHVERRRWQKRQAARKALEEARIVPDAATRAAVHRLAGVGVTSPSNWAQILRRQDVDAEKVAAELPELAGLTAEDRRIVIGLLRYEGYLTRHARERERLRRLRDVPIPADLNPATIPGLSHEVADIMRQEKPRTLAEAERLAGVTPAALAILAGRIARRGAS